MVYLAKGPVDWNHGKYAEANSSSERALADYTQAIRLKPDFVDAYNKRATLYSQRGETEKAIADFQKVMDIQARSEGG